MAERHIEYLKLDDIKPFDRNPKAHADLDIQASIHRFGFTNGMLLCERRKELAEGHGRLDALQVLRNAGEPPPEGIQVIEGEWLAPVQRGWSSENDREFEAYVAAANQLTIKGGWDTNILEYLEAIEDFTGTGFDDTDIEDLKNLVNLPEELPKKPYSYATNVPHYEPVGPVPEVETLYDEEVAQFLVEEIEEAEIDEDVRAFLITAARRHTVINYRKVAEFYPFQIPEVKRLMERSALVIIDFEDAIKHGYVSLTQSLEELRAGDE